MHPGADMLMMMYLQAVPSDDSCYYLLLYATFQENIDKTSKNLVLLRFFDKNIFYNFMDNINITFPWDYGDSLRKMNGSVCILDLHVCCVF